MVYGAFAYCYHSGTANAKRTSSDILGIILLQLTSTIVGLELVINWREGHQQTNSQIRRFNI